MSPLKLRTKSKLAAEPFTQRAELQVVSWPCAVMSAKEAHNEVHITENWRQTVRREQTQAKHFNEIWGFLAQPGPPTSLTRPHAVKTVKYINPAGGTWTVAAQRIPAQSKDEMEMDAAVLRTEPLFLDPCKILHSGKTKQPVLWQL